MISQTSLAQAQELVYQHMAPTSQFAWPLLCEALGLEVWMKHENHTPTGAFKVRGGLVYLDELSRSEPGIELVTATRGNHGQSIPYAARMYDRQVHVYVPHGNSAEKNAAMRAWGAQLYEYGNDFDEAREEAVRVAQARGAHLVSSFSEHLVRGVATYPAELFAAVPDLDVVYVPIGMGSGATAMVCVRDLVGSKADVVGVVSRHADAFAQSYSAGEIIQTESAHTFADGVATRVPHPDAFEILHRGLDRVVSVSDDEIAQAVRLIFTTTHNVAEGAGAIATAALMQEVEQGRLASDRKVGVVLTGGNIDADWFAQILAGATPSVA